MGVGSLACSGQTRPVVFRLLGRALKFPRGCLRSPWGGEEGVLSRLGYMSSNRIAPLVAVLHIGVQGKILFALRGLLLKKKVGKPLTRPSAPNWSPRSPRFWGRLFTLPSTTGHLSLLALLGALANLSSRDHGQVTTMPCSEAFTPGWKERLFSERGKGLDSQKRSLPGTKMGSFDLSCPF